MGRERKLCLEMKRLTNVALAGDGGCSRCGFPLHCILDLALARYLGLVKDASGFVLIRLFLFISEH
jgi:hypothetical protein